jgi:hypothetical protein
MQMGTIKLAVPVLVACACGPFPALATSILPLDLAGFTVLGSAAVTNVPPSTIGGNVGDWQSGGANAITGFNASPGVAVADPQVTGTVDQGTTTGTTANAMLAQNQLTAAITSLASYGSGTILALADLAGQNLMPGVYTVPAGATNLSGTLILNGNGLANQIWIFQLPSTLITSPNSVVEMTDVGAGDSVYWDVGSSATIGTDSTFLGNILADVSVTLDSTATDLCGRALAETGAVSLDDNTLTTGCTGILTGSSGVNLAASGGLNGASAVTGGTGGGGTTVPEPATLALLGAALLGFGVLRRRRNGTEIARVRSSQHR